MLARDTTKVSTFRGLKSTFLYAKVAAGTRDKELTDDKAIRLLQKEAKKREESADLYAKGGENGRAEQELSEKKIIEQYLPAKLSEEKLVEAVDSVISANPGFNMGQTIAEVKNKTAGTADGADIARIVKEKLGL